MRLIDADKIIDSLGISDIDLAIGAVIDEQSTAFDVDKVVEQLKELKMRYFLTIANTGDADKDCAYKNIANTIDRAIDIVSVVAERFNTESDLVTVSYSRITNSEAIDKSTIKITIETTDLEVDDVV